MSEGGCCPAASEGEFMALNLISSDSRRFIGEKQVAISSGVKYNCTKKTYPKGEYQQGHGKTKAASVVPEKECHPREVIGDMARREPTHPRTPRPRLFSLS